MMNTNDFNKSVNRIMVALFGMIPVLALLLLAVIFSGVLPPILGGLFVLGGAVFILYKVWRAGK